MDNSSSLQVISVIISVIFYAGIYVWISLALAKVFAKLGEESWKAWVPYVNTFTIFKLGGQPIYWAILLLVPFVQIVGYIFYIIALNGISKRFGRGGGFTVIAVIAFPIWASILGFGKATAVDPNAAPVYEPASRVPYGAPPISQPPAAATSPGLPIGSAPSIAPPPPPPPPAAPVTAAPVAAFAPGLPSGQAPIGGTPIIGSAPGLPISPPPPPPAQPLMQPYGQVPAQGNPWAPPGTPVNRVAPVAPPAPPAPIVEPVAVVAPPAPAAPVVPIAAPIVIDEPDLDDDEDGRTMLSGRATHDDDEGDEHTVIVGRRMKQWILTTDDGQSIRLTQPVVLLGRNPSRDPNFPTAQLVPVNDTAKTVSKTHARIELVNGAWQIVDLDSTNGVVLHLKNDEIELQAGVAAVLTESFLLGELPVRIHQES
jgi:hypothetical protein